jgi:hypothetical protein
MTSPPTERLSPAHLTWLKQFSVVMHRWYSYPPKHPSRVASQETALAALCLALGAQGEIVIAVSRHQLSVGGLFSDAKNPTLGELAERLHRHGIGTITLRDGITDAEFDALLERVTRQRTNDAEDEAVRERPIGSHVAVEMLSYDGLALSEEETDDARGPDGTGDRLWRELAEFALAGWDGVDDFGEGGGGGASQIDGDSAGAIAADTADTAIVEQAPQPTDRRTGTFSLATELPAAMNAGNIARVINARAGDPQFAATALQSLIKIGRHARKRGRAGSGTVAARLRETMQALNPDTLKSLLFAEKDPARQRLLFLQGVDALPVSAVLDWIEAAAGSSGQSISQHLLRLLRKLSSQTRRRRDAGPDEGGEALREAARQLIDNWFHEINETDEHTELLEQIAGYDTPDAPLDAGEAAGSDRLLQIALETESFGADVLTAVDRMIQSRRIGRMLSLLDAEGHSDVAGPAIHAHLVADETLRRILLSEPIDFDGAQQLLDRCGPVQADAMLDALSISESKATRQLIIDRLRDIGEAARDSVIARLDGAPWYVQRNLLSLLGGMPTPPEGVALDVFLRHEQPTIRVEAVKLLARYPDRREYAIHEGLADTDALVVRAALEAGAQGFPRRSVARLLQVLAKTEEGSELRIRGIPLLEQIPLPGARDWLLTIVGQNRGFIFRRWQLRQKSPEVLAALRVLAAKWSGDPLVARTFALARKSVDAHLREAAGFGGVA